MWAEKRWAIKTGLLGWAEKRWAKKTGLLGWAKKQGKILGWAKKRWADFLLTEWLSARPGLLENKSSMIGG